MEKASSPIPIFDLWLLMGKVHHSILLSRQRELREFPMHLPSTDVLYTIQALGLKATLSEVAKQVERRSHVISRQAINMEKDGLIKRIKNSSNSKLLRLELTQKGIDVVKIAGDSKSIEAIFSCLSKEERRQSEAIFNKLLIQAKEHAL